MTSRMMDEAEGDGLISRPPGNLPDPRHHSAVSLTTPHMPLSPISAATPTPITPDPIWLISARPPHSPSTTTSLQVWRWHRRAPLSSLAVVGDAVWRWSSSFPTSVSYRLTHLARVCRFLGSARAWRWDGGGQSAPVAWILLSGRLREVRTCRRGACVSPSRSASPSSSASSPANMCKCGYLRR